MAELRGNGQAGPIKSDESIQVDGVEVPLVIKCNDGVGLKDALEWVDHNLADLEAKLKASSVVVDCVFANGVL